MFFFFLAALIPHSDHSSSARTREMNNTSDVSLVEQRLFATPPFLSTDNTPHTRVRVCCPLIAASLMDLSAALSGADLIDPLLSLDAIR